MNDYFKYRFDEDIEFSLKEGDFVSIIGNNNDLLVHTLLHGNKKANIFLGDIELNKINFGKVRRRMNYVLYRDLDIFVAETVMDEIAFGLESLAMGKNDIKENIESMAKTFKLTSLLDKDPNSLGCSDKIKMKIMSSLIIKPKILVIDNIISLLDYKDKILVFDILKEYVKNGGIVINFTNDIEETMFGEKIIIIYDKKLVCEGKTLSVLNEEKILKRLGLGLPFIVELNKYLMDYKLIDKYYLTNKKLVGAIWK
ncbi:MAG: hypothetical protein MR938_00400 [Tenericutes bacterium]|nr:hypothetical protein [Mycoplasmatota bacterium]